MEAYPDYIGKDCETVLRDLIVEINEAGYFVDDIDGNKKEHRPAAGAGLGTSQRRFPGGYERQHAGSGQGIEISSGIVTIDDDDYDPAYAKDGKPSPYITLEKAQEIALAQANVNAADAVFDDKGIRPQRRNPDF